jgi:hypothetical protein
MANPETGTEFQRAVDEVLDPVLREHRRLTRYRSLLGLAALMGAVTVLSYVVFGQAPWPELLGFGVLGAFCARSDRPKGPESGAPNRTRALGRT